MYILGISALYHDSAACLISSGEIIAAAQEERFSRIKHDASFPIHSIKYCIEEANIDPSQIEYIAFYDKPFLKFERLLETYLAFVPKGLTSFVKSMPIWIKDKLFQKSLITKELQKLFGDSINWQERILFSEHHMSHAASAFFPSPFHEAAVLTLDGVGEWTTSSIAVGKANKLHIKKEIHFPHSLGLLYSAFTYFIGFKVNSGEYKLMGLAPYGEPKYVDLIKEFLIDIKDDGSFFLDMSYFNYPTGLTMTNKNFELLFGGPPRKPESEITKREMDLAASIQKITEEVLLKIASALAKETGQVNLCLAGGVALNCVANGILMKSKIFKEIWVQPAAGDAGGCIGAAYSIYHNMLDMPRVENESFDSMNGSYLGPNFSLDDIENRINKLGAIYSKHSEADVIQITAKALIEGKAIGWMNGRMEFGPRSLGSRSIIADPRSPKMQKLLNLKIKYRESFRPFAPSILFEDVSNWFEMQDKSPYMLFVAELVKSKHIESKIDELKLSSIEKLNIPRSEIPAVTHIDFSARIQTVHKETNPKYYNLIKTFKELTGCPILVNTSFNVRGEPIVCSPDDAFKCFMGTELDLLIIDNIVLFKHHQILKKDSEYFNQYELD